MVRTPLPHSTLHPRHTALHSNNPFTFSKGKMMRAPQFASPLSIPTPTYEYLHGSLALVRGNSAGGYLAMEAGIVYAVYPCASCCIVHRLKKARAFSLPLAYIAHDEKVTPTLHSHTLGSSALLFANGEFGTITPPPCRLRIIVGALGHVVP